ncbi:MAG: hypothetical protein H7263_10000 [Candidatus Sericytochromatia bacterium]|nr:hypothetical protein [Candidatus Sericytochromatia bacterium]
MNNKKIALSLLVITLNMFSLVGCNKTEEVKVKENVVLETTPKPNEKVNVNVDVQQPQQPVERTKTDVVVVNNDKSGKDLAVMNANIQKLQDQLKSSNDQSKIELNKQIQKMNADKLQLQKQVATLQTKSVQANAKTQSDQNLDITKQQYRDSSRTKIDDFSKKMDDLKTKVANLNDPEKTQADNDISRIEDSKAETEKKLNDIDASKDISSLKIAKNQIDNMLTDLDKKYTQLLASKFSGK